MPFARISAGRLFVLLPAVLVYVIWPIASCCGEVNEGMSGYWKFDESEGMTAYDASGRLNDATVHGANLSWAPETGVRGGSLWFDGDANFEYVEIPTRHILILRGTVACWIRVEPDPQTPDTRYIFGHTTLPAYNNRIQLYMDGGDTDLDVGLGDEHAVEAGVATLAPGRWYHVALTWDSGEYVVYVDGAERARGPYTGLDEFDEWAHIGNNGYVAPTQVFHGHIDDFRVYRRALNADDAAALAFRAEAYNPIPREGSLNDSRWVWLSWEAGNHAQSYDLYFGTNRGDVVSGQAETYLGNQTDDYALVGMVNFLRPEPLEAGTTYYWRVDAVNDVHVGSPWKGDVWDFRVRPESAYQPYPSNGNKFVEPDVELKWMPGLDAEIHYVFFGESYEQVRDAHDGILSIDNTYRPPGLENGQQYYWRVDEVSGQQRLTGDIWTFRTAREGGGVRGEYFSGKDFEIHQANRVDETIDFDWGELPAHPLVGSDNYSIRWTAELEAAFDETYTFYAMTDDGVRLWIDGQLLIDHWFDQSAIERSGSIDLAAGPHSLLMEYYENAGHSVAQLRWESPSTVKQIVPQGALSLPVKAGAPRPRNGSANVFQSVALTWTAGERAISHDIYLGTDATAVAEATRESAQYKGSTSLGNEVWQTENLAWDTRYYWRVDEVNDVDPNNGGVWKGNVWDFSTADFLLIDGMEDYNNYEGYRVFETWKDGWNSESNGALIGHSNPDFAGGENFVETEIVHGGQQAMPFYYDNASGHSAATRTLGGIKRDWSQHRLQSLSVWHRGYPRSDGSLTEGPEGTYTMTGAGADIWAVNGIEADEFHFAWKALKGAGAITARISAIENLADDTELHPWAKAGLMIRESLDPNSAHALLAVTGDQGIAFQYRPGDGQTSINDTQLPSVSQRPHWLSLEREFSGRMAAYHANDVNGVPDTWTQLGSADVPMEADVYIGLALTSHQRYAKARAVFSEIATAGTISGEPFASEDIGVVSNTPAPLYIAVEDGEGNLSQVEHPDPNVALSAEWREWNIALRDFEDVNRNDIHAVTIGFGLQDDPEPGARGLVIFDDIRLYGYRCLPETAKSDADFNADCVVDMRDLRMMARQWLLGDVDLQADLNGDEAVDFADYAVLCGDWLDERLWP